MVFSGENRRALTENQYMLVYVGGTLRTPQATQWTSSPSDVSKCYFVGM